MDRGLNLEALTEEDDEESWGRSDSESGDEGDDGMRGREPNQFDNLCDGVLACMAVVHAALQEMLELKDELLRHSLPPSVLTRTALVTSKVFRSLSDMHVPVGELIRMVRLYSTPWEEKSTALKKLHDDYEGKKTQLNIAIKRLEMIDAHSKQIARERCVMNWEKLFAKLTAAKGHGRRWKFLIDAFKKRANLGMEKLQEYLDTMDASSSDEEEEEEEAEVATQMQHAGIGSPSINQEEEEAEEASSESESSSEDEDGSKDMKESEVVSEVDSGAQQKAFEEEEVKKVVSIRPPTKDAEIWAGEPEFDQELHIRVFQPEGLDCRELRCVLNLGDAMRKTDVLDMNHDEEEQEVKPSPPKEEKVPTTPKRGGRGRGLIGARGNRASPSKTPTLQMAPLLENEEDAPAEEGPPEKQKYYEVCVFDFPEEMPDGVLNLDGQPKVTPPEHLRVSVHFGPREEIVAMATIHMTDLYDLELPTITLDAPVGDVFDQEVALQEQQARAEQAAKAASAENAITEVQRANTETDGMGRANTENKEEDSEGQAEKEEEEEVVEEKEVEEDEEKPKVKKEKPFDDITQKLVNEALSERKAFLFPLYSIHAGRSDTVHLPCGQLPLLCYWVKRERARKLSKITESMSVKELVFDLTGIDLNVTTKEDIHKETRDEALSTISFTPEPTEETVARSEYDRLMTAHNEEMEMLQADYEQRLQELMDTIQQLQEAQMEMSALAAMPQAMAADPVNNFVEQSPPPGSQPTRSRSRTPKRGTATVTTSIGGMPAGTTNSDSPFETYTRHATSEPLVPPSNKHTETDSIMYISQQAPPQQPISKPLPKWGKNLSENFFERLHQFEMLSTQRKAELREQLVREMQGNLEKKMASQFRLANKHEEGLFDAMQDVSLPAVFLPSKSNNMQIFNPRANKYFHPSGAGGARLSQPPSMLQLPPLPKSKMSVLNLFDVSQNFTRGGPDWLMQRYLLATATTAQEATPYQEAAAADMRGATPAQQSQKGHPPQTLQEGAKSKPSSSSSKGRQSGASSHHKSRSALSNHQVAAAASTTPVRHQVTLPGSAPLEEPRVATRSGGSRRAPSAASPGSPAAPAGRVSQAATRSPLAKSVSPCDYAPPRSAATLSATPGMIKTPAPVGQQEVGLKAPVPPLRLVEGGTPT